jgi:hypothetical protein
MDPSLKKYGNSANTPWDIDVDLVMQTLYFYVFQ